MIETSLAPNLTATILHRASGTIGQHEAETGAADALRFAQQMFQQQSPANLLIDLRGIGFQDLQAHKAWSLGFIRHPLLGEHIAYVAIIGDNTPGFQAERELMQAERVRFFDDLPAAEVWLGQVGQQSAI